MIDANRIPLHETEHAPEAIREAAVAWHEAQASHRAARNALGRLDGGRLKAREADAEQAALDRRAGKAGTARKHEQAYDKALDAAEHEERVARALERQTRSDYQRALDQHADEWREQADAHAALVDEAYFDQLAATAAAHRDRVAAHARRRLLGATDGPAGAARLRPEQLADSVTRAKLELARLDDPASRWRQRVVVPIPALLDALQAADEVEEIGPMPGFAVGNAIKQAAEHAHTAWVRGYSDEEVRENRAPSIGPRDLRPVSVYVPGES